MNGFFVPQLGSMIYTMNGMTTQLNLQADTAGIFHGLSAQFSGDGFSDMHFEVQARPGRAILRLGRSDAQGRPRRSTPRATRSSPSRA